MVFGALEKSGLHINRQKFEEKFHLLNSDYTYTQYNFKTLTTRPSNRFNGVNYAAINKDNGDRECFIPRNNELLEIDIRAYHPTLLASLIGYKFKKQDIHEAFAEMYGVGYQTSKELTFKQLYGGVFDKYKHLEFFSKVQSYTDQLWHQFNTHGYIECPISKHRFYKDKLIDMKPQKLLNYLLQNMETANNIKLLWQIFRILRGCKTKLVLYTYDAFLFDYDTSEKEILTQIEQIFFDNKLNIKLTSGSNYSFK